MDAIVQLDGELRVTGMNPAAERTFETPDEHARGMPLTALVSPGDATSSRAGPELEGRPPNGRSAWVSGGFTGLKPAAAPSSPRGRCRSSSWTGGGTSR